MRRFFGLTSKLSSRISSGDFSVISCHTALKQTLLRFLNEIRMYETVKNNNHHVFASGCQKVFQKIKRQCSAEVAISVCGARFRKTFKPLISLLAKLLVSTIVYLGLKFSKYPTGLRTKARYAISKYLKTAEVV